MCEDDGDVDEDEEDNDYSMQSSGQVCWEVSWESGLETDY